MELVKMSKVLQHVMMLLVKMMLVKTMLVKTMLVKTMLVKTKQKLKLQSFLPQETKVFKMLWCAQITQNCLLTEAVKQKFVNKVTYSKSMAVASKNQQ